MSIINFSIQNPDKDNQAIILLGKKNTLNFVFKVTGNQFIKDDTITLNIPKDLLKSPEALKFSSTDWLPASPVVKPDKYQLLFTYQGTQLKDVSTYTLTLKQWEGVKVVNNKSITTKYILNGSPLGGTSEVLNVKKSNTDLNKVLRFSTRINDASLYPALKDSVWISPTDDQKKISVPIASTIVLDIGYQGTSPLVSGWDTHHPPTFTISFEYGDSSTNLTDIDLALKINATVHPKSKWKIERISKSISDKVNTSLLYWQITPEDSNHNLFNIGDKLIINFCQVITTSPEGYADVLLSWKNFPGFDNKEKDRELSVHKIKSLPKICDFKAFTAIVPYNQPAKLQCTVFALFKVYLGASDTTSSQEWICYNEGDSPQLVYQSTKEVYYEGKGKQKTKYIIDSTPDKLDQQELTITWNNFPPPSINSFTGEYKEESNEHSNTLLLKWDTIPFMNYAHSANIELVDGGSGDRIMAGLKPQDHYSKTINEQNPMPTRIVLNAKTYEDIGLSTRSLSNNWSEEGTIVYNHVAGLLTVYFSKIGKVIFVTGFNSDNTEVIYFVNYDFSKPHVLLEDAVMIGENQDSFFLYTNEGIIKYFSAPNFNPENPNLKTIPGGAISNEMYAFAFSKNKVFSQNNREICAISISNGERVTISFPKKIAQDWDMEIVKNQLFMLNDGDLYMIDVNEFKLENLKKIEGLSKITSICSTPNRLHYNSTISGMGYIDVTTKVTSTLELSLSVDDVYLLSFNQGTQVLIVNRGEMQMRYSYFDYRNNFPISLNSWFEDLLQTLWISPDGVQLFAVVGDEIMTFTPSFS